MKLADLLAAVEWDLGRRPARSECQFLRVPGVNLAVAGTAEGVVAGGGMVNRMSRSGQQVEFVSSSIQDDPTLGGSTGAWTIAAWFLTWPDWTIEIEIVELAGLTPVNSDATDIVALVDMVVLTSGSSQQAVGRVDCRHTVGSPIYGSIPAGTTTAMDCRGTVPAGYRDYLYSWEPGSRVNATNSDGALYMLGDSALGRDAQGPAAYPPVVIHSCAEVSGGQSVPRDLTMPRALYPGDTWEVQAVGLNTAASICAAVVDILRVRTGDRIR